MTSTSHEFVDEKFEVIPEIKPVQRIEEKQEEEEKKRGPGRPPITPLTQDETFTFVKGILVLPNAFLPKLPSRTDDQLRPFSNELYQYCLKKNICIRDYFFDEFGLVCTGAVLFRGYVDDYKRYYPAVKKEKTKEEIQSDKKLNADFDHQKEVDEKNKAAVEQGIIKTEGV